MHVEGRDYPEHIDPLKDWLIANGVDWDSTPAWPQVVIGQAGTLLVEQFHRDSDGHPTIHQGGGGSVYSEMREYTLTVPPDPRFWAAYQHSRPIAKRRAELGALARDLRSLGYPDGRSLVVVIPASGDSLAVFTSEQVDSKQGDRIVRELEWLLPGVCIGLVGGIAGIVQVKDAGGRAAG